MTAQELLARPGRYRLRIEDYQLLDDAGVFEGRQTELIDGDVILMSPQYRPHMFVKNELAFALRLALRNIGSELYVGTEASVSSPPHDLPQPDIVLTSEARGAGPIPIATVALIVEVAASTLEQDLARKAALYARSGVPEYWVADVDAASIRQLSAPSTDAYSERRDPPFGAAMTATTISGLVIMTDTLR